MSRQAAVPDVAHPAAHERLMAALRASRCGTWRWDVPRDVVEWDEALCGVYGIPRHRAPRTSREFVALIHPEDRERTLATLGACLAGGGDLDYEFRAVVGDRVLWIYDRSTLVRDAAGRPAYMTGACLDVTDRKRIEAELATALEQQRLLFTELNHRVKNHLQMIAAVLRLQGARQELPAVRAEFEKAIGRIDTIADLHGRLYRDCRVGDVDMAAYLADICDGLRRLVPPGTPVAVECTAEPVSLGLDQAVPLGLVVNELATNAIRHAFPAGAAGRVRVGLVRQGDACVLTVADDGCGLVEPAQEGTGIGRRIVGALAAQIGASLTVEQAAGTVCRLAFRPA
ncbi:MAG: PAS domain-containing protein [Alphaproteobacteria bacterium]|nr:PAS domain-containing protein [Alphaproteobacteria bacterium]